jgi:hypothetical protein
VLVAQNGLPPVGRQGLQRKSFFAARPQKRLQRKARFWREAPKGADIFLDLLTVPNPPPLLFPRVLRYYTRMFKKYFCDLRSKA